jgi:hypothetical protein
MLQFWVKSPLSVSEHVNLRLERTPLKNVFQSKPSVPVSRFHTACTAFRVQGIITAPTAAVQNKVKKEKGSGQRLQQ